MNEVPKNEVLMNDVARPRLRHDLLIVLFLSILMAVFCMSGCWNFSGGSKSRPKDGSMDVHIECTGPEECVDDNPCTVDDCVDNMCTHSPGNQGEVCRPAVNECDMEEQCDGESTECPADEQRPDESSCTEDGNPCTIDICVAGACAHPAGNFGSVCREASNECDQSEECDGESTECPLDELQPDNTPCTEDGNPCTADTCLQGSCEHVDNGGVVCDTSCYPQCCPTVIGDCGNCGKRTCQANGYWGGCANEGECQAGSTCYAVNDGDCNGCTAGQQRLCNPNCYWGGCYGG